MAGWAVENPATFEGNLVAIKTDTRLLKDIFVVVSAWNRVFSWEYFVFFSQGANKQLQEDGWVSLST